MTSTCVQQGDNPAVLNPVDSADPNAYTVCGGMTTGNSEDWGEQDESS
jgi:hypothetical protein